MKIYLLTKPDCAKCEKLLAAHAPAVRAKRVQVENTGTVDGMMLLAMYELADKPFPIVIVERGETNPATDYDAGAGYINADRLLRTALKEE